MCLVWRGHFLGTPWVICFTALSVIVLSALALSPLPGGATRLDDHLRRWYRSNLHDRLVARRPLLYAYAIVALLGVIVFVIWVLPITLTRYPTVGDAADRHMAIAATRTSVVAALAVTGAAGGLVYTARTYRVTREGHITDRYTRAVEQLGSEAAAIRLGGIYALEGLMRDSASDQPTIVEVLASFVRQRAPLPVVPTDVRAMRGAGRTSDDASGSPGDSRPAEDVQAALVVLCRRPSLNGDRPLNLSSTCLTWTNLANANLTRANLANANLTGADLTNANLIGATLTGATLTKARLDQARIIGANLRNSNLTQAGFDKANVSDTYLNGANLAGASLVDADLHRATLRRADLTDADLTGVNLASANISRANLTRADLTNANLADVNLDTQILPT